MKQYRLVDNIFGWVAFIIAAFTYCSTIEPTASFWDCPEFITTAYKQEIGHPPGAPFFMLLGNFFTALYLHKLSGLKTLFQKMQFTAVSAVPSQTAAPKPPPLH